MNVVPRVVRPRPLSPAVVALVALLLAAFGLRVFGLNWDRGQYLHPDELFITDWVLIQRIHLEWPPDLSRLLDPAVSGLNPRAVNPETGFYWDDYAYGALPLLVTDLVAEAVTRVTGEDWHGRDKVYLVGRTLSAVFDTATVALVYALGARIASRRVGLLGATVAALAPISIQLAHFFTTDSWLTFFVALSLLTAARAAENGSVRRFAIAGAAFGLAMATKGSVFTLAAVIGVAVAFDFWRRRGRDDDLGRVLGAAARRVLAAGGGALAGFALFEPYALLKPDVYLRALRLQAEIVSGRNDVPYTRQYVGTTPGVYQLEQFLRWGFGPVAGLLAIGGAVVLVRRLGRERAGGQWVVLAWLAGYGLVIGVAETKFLRYLAPLVPVLAVMAGLSLDAIWRAFASRGRPRLAGGVVAALLVGVALWTAAFETVYAGEQTRLAASRWIYANVPAGAGLSHEYWDDELPKGLGLGLTPLDRQYRIVEMDLYDPKANGAPATPTDVAAMLYETLQRVDFVVLSSNRVSSAVPRSPWRYPVQTRYYELLRDGKLGFGLAAEFGRPPALGPWRFVDHDADESFINYDHPRVLIYRKEGLVARPVYDRLMAWAIARPWSPTRYAERPSLLLDEPVGERPIVADARWSEAITGTSVGALAIWLVLLATLQVAGWPLASLVFGRFADAGWGLSRLVALVVSGYLVWIGASVRLISFRAVWAAVAVAIVGGVGWALFRRARRRGGGWAFRGSQARVAVGAEVTFWVVFALFLLFRYLNPDGWHPIWGGEKPMEFAHLNATLRSAHFPPHDPWFADGVLNYYYYGLYLVAFCLKLTGIPSEIGFNLAQPTMIALLASAGYSVAAALGERVGGWRSRGWRTAVGAGAVGALLLVGIGNLATLRLLLDRERLVGDGFLDWTWGPSRAISSAITEFPFFTGLYADLHAHVVALPITVLAIALCYALAADERGVARALGAGGPVAARAVLATRLALLTLVLGTLSAANAWDVPVYAALTVVALVMATRLVRGRARRLAAVLGLGAPLALGAYLLFSPFYRHYVALFGSLERVVAPTPPVEVASHLGGLGAIATLGLVVALLPRGGRAPGLLREPALWLAIVGGLVLVAFVAPRGVEADDAPRWGDAAAVGVVVVGAALLAMAVWNRTTAGAASGRERGLMRGGLVIAVVAIGAAMATERVALAGFLGVGGAAVAVWLTGNTPAVRFAGAMAAAAAFVGAGTEVVVLADNLIGTPEYRMNTVFKFYNQVWVLLALAGAALVALMAVEGRASRTEPGGGGRGNGSAAVGIVPGGEAIGLGGRRVPLARETAVASARRIWGRAGVGVTGLAVALSLLYPATATVPRLEQRFAPDLGSGTLDAMDWMAYGRLPLEGRGGGQELAFDGDRAAIDWLNRNVEGSPTIAEASIGWYRCNGSRISIGTGLPTIIGWENHESQQRYAETLPERVEDVARLYRTADPAEKRSILDRYDVAYVVVGQLERDGVRILPNQGCAAAPSPAGIAAFERMVGSDLEVAFTERGTTIYRVLPIPASGIG